ncbi:hypothetical protein DERP_010266, partial [Dermatophagoides pteronyssinus]
ITFPYRDFKQIKTSNLLMKFINFYTDDDWGKPSIILVPMDNPTGNGIYGFENCALVTCNDDENIKV